ncbi:hypothetical protein MTO96_040100 [Rhipicephalus appendiculatus]
MDVAAAHHERQLDFVGRLVAVPLVSVLFSRVSQLYEEAKNRSLFISVPMRVVETTITKTALVCRALFIPVLSRQLLYAEALACRVLDEVEQRCPEAFCQTDEIIAHVVIKAAQLMLCVITKMAALWEWTIAAAALLIGLTANVTAIVRLLWTAVHGAVDAAEHQIDAEPEDDMVPSPTSSVSTLTAEDSESDDEEDYTIIGDREIDDVKDVNK